VGDQVQLLGSYTLDLSRLPAAQADMEWDTFNHSEDVQLSSNCLTASKAFSRVGCRLARSDASVD
jgi:hypothetical protein